MLVSRSCSSIYVRGISKALYSYALFIDVIMVLVKGFVNQSHPSDCINIINYELRLLREVIMRNNEHSWMLTDSIVLLTCDLGMQNNLLIHLPTLD